MKVSVQIYKRSNLYADCVTEYFEELEKARKYARKVLDDNTEYYKASILYDGKEETLLSYQSVILKKSYYPPQYDDRLRTR